MEDLLAAHRKQQRDLQSQITQKKKSASKKTRKGVNDECTRLEEDLKARQQAELDSLKSSAESDEANGQIIDQGLPTEKQPEDDDLLAAIVNSAASALPVSLTAKTPAIDPNDDNEDSDTRQSTSRKPNRQKARLARRVADQEAAAAQAAAEASNLPDLKQRERTRMLEEFGKRGLKEKEVAANGHCLYSAIADQMKQLGLSLSNETSEEKDNEEEKKELRTDDYRTVRLSAASYISSNAEDFAPFLEEPLDEYVRKIRETGEWGGQLELMALAKMYSIDINVLQGDGRVEKIVGTEEGKLDVPAAWLAYYKHGFGLGEHYNSLRKS
jgi:OTU domain-containing protein 6